MSTVGNVNEVEGATMFEKFTLHLERLHEPFTTEHTSILHLQDILT
jgi:hypothetical protein